MAKIEQPISLNGRHESEAMSDEVVEAVAAEGATPETEGSEPGETTRESTGTTEATTEPVEAEVVPSFLSELASAMQSVATRERERLAAAVADDAAAHIERARAEGEDEASAYRRVADEDVASIEAWADQEVERIRADAARRAAERRTDLDATLTQHEAVIAAEIESVEKAVVAYDDRLEAFVSDLAGSTDPERIAQMAGALPRPPDLGDVRASARAAALASIAEASAGRGTSPSAPDLDTAGMVDASGDGTAASVEIDGPVDAPIETTATADGPGIDGGPAIDGDAASEVDADPASAVEAEAGDLGDLVAEMPVPSRANVDDDSGAADPGDLGWGTGPSSIGSALDASPSQPADASSRPVAVMDPTVTEASRTEEPLHHPFGHTNAAVRLIRSVAPWTAPTERTPEAKVDRD